MLARVIEPWPLQFRIDRHTTPGDPGECWKWSGAHNGSNYPVLGIQRPGKKSTNSVSVARLILWLKEPDRPLFGHSWVARHTCDVNWCVNPAHLIPGSMKDNAQDMWTRGKGRPHHRLTEDDVRKIRALRAQGWAQKAIANEVGTDQSHVSAILLGKVWAWLE